MTAAGDGLGSPLDMLWSADRVARLLALTEQANRCDGWWTADDLGQLSLDAPLRGPRREVANRHRKTGRTVH